MKSLNRLAGSIGLIAFVALLFVPALGFAQDDGTEELKVDRGHSSVLFRANHAGIGYVFGGFGDFSGTIKYNEENPEKSAINLEIQTDSVETWVDKRDKHLQSADFFHSKKYPKMTFESTKVERVDDETLRVTGDLTVRDVTKEISIKVKELGKGQVRDKFHRGFYTEFDINRNEFNVDWKPDAGVAGKMVRIKLALEGARPAK